MSLAINNGQKRDVQYMIVFITIVTTTSFDTEKGNVHWCFCVYII